MRAGRLFSGDREEVSKAVTASYWPWWKALWMFTSSVCGGHCELRCGWCIIGFVAFGRVVEYPYLLPLRMDPYWCFRGV